MTILKWFKNPIWLPSPRPQTGPGCHGCHRGCPGLHPRLPRTLAPGPGYHPRLPDTSPRPWTASKAASDTSPGPQTSSKAAPDIICGNWWHQPQMGPGYLPRIVFLDFHVHLHCLLLLSLLYASLSPPPAWLLLMSCIYGYWMDTLLVACHCPATPLHLSEHVYICMFICCAV